MLYVAVSGWQRSVNMSAKAFGGKKKRKHTITADFFSLLLRGLFYSPTIFLNLAQRQTGEHTEKTLDAG
jgi:hypothetical protein